MLFSQASMRRRHVSINLGESKTKAALQSSHKGRERFRRMEHDLSSREATANSLFQQFYRVLHYEKIQRSHASYKMKDLLTQGLVKPMTEIGWDISLLPCI